MKRFGSFLLWSACFVLLLVALDLAMTRLPPSAGIAGEARRFYADLRDRVLQLAPTEEKGETPAAPTPYLYVDGEGGLHFADSLQDVPPAYRHDARPMEH